MRHWLRIAVLLTACGGEDSPPTAAPTGTVLGEVWNGLQWSLVAGASVELRVGDRALAGTTDQDGWFVIRDVPAGSALPVDFRAEGYAPARTWAFLDDAAGDYPQANSIAEVVAVLRPTVGSVGVRVVGGDDGEGVGGVRVIARPWPDEYGMEILGAVEATTDADGLALLAGLAARAEYYLRTIAAGYGSAGDSFTEGERGEIELWVSPVEEEEVGP